MAAPTNTAVSYSQTNIREDLEKMVYNVDPYKTPVLNTAKKTKATQHYHEWSTDSLAAQNTANAQIEGDTATPDVTNAVARLGNYTQISRKVVSLSGSLQAAKASGQTNSMGYQMLKKSRELKRDIEGVITKNAPKVVGTSVAAANTAGLPAWITANTVFNSGGVPAGANPTGVTAAGSENFGNGTTARTYSGTAVALTESDLLTLYQSIFKNSGQIPPYLVVSPKNKQNVSQFTGPGTRFEQVKDKRLNVAIDVYQTDFGDVRMVPDIFLAQSGDCYAIDPEYVRFATFRPFETVPLAKTGDNDQKMLIVEYALEVANEHAIGGIFDTTG